MFGFFVKKNFWDSWENIGHIVIVNMVPLAVVVALSFLGLNLFSSESQVSYVSLKFFLFIMLASVLLSVCFFAEGKNALGIASFGKGSFAEYIKSIPHVLKDAVLLGVVIGLLICVALISLPYYYRMWRPVAEDGSSAQTYNFMGLVLMAFIGWFLLLTFLALQWFVPLQAMQGNKFIKALKKCYILLFDNLWFTVGVAAVNLFTVFLTVLSLGILGSVAGTVLTWTNALRLRMYKYDWQEVNPGLSQQELRNVPWKELLERDVATFGPHSFKSFFFPWRAK